MTGLMPPAPQAIESTPTTLSVRSLIVDRGHTELRSREVPRPGPGEVLIHVAAVGLCRTDLAVMSGALPIQAPLIPGHEFAGIIRMLGSGVDSLQPGQRVTVHPLLHCGRCKFCIRSQPEYCQSTRFLGLDLDGACSELVLVPASSVYPLPRDIPFTTAAFSEPVAASLGVLNSGITPADRGVIIGDNRISRLTERVLRAHGFTRLEVCSTADAGLLPEDDFDYAIETEATPAVLAQMRRVVRPRGRYILKSRPSQPVPIDFRQLLPKEPILHAVHYGLFHLAVELLGNGRVDVEDLIGRCWPLSRHTEAIRDAESGEQLKTFLMPVES